MKHVMVCADSYAMFALGQCSNLQLFDAPTFGKGERVFIHAGENTQPLPFTITDIWANAFGYVCELEILDSEIGHG